MGITNLITNVVKGTFTYTAEKPGITFLICQSSAYISIVSWINMCSPFISFGVAVTGLLIGLHSLYRIWQKEHPRKHKHKLHE